MNTGLCGFVTLIYFHIDSYWFLKNGALDGAQWSTDNITISPDTSRKKWIWKPSILIVVKGWWFYSLKEVEIDNLAVF